MDVRILTKLFVCKFDNFTIIFMHSEGGGKNARPCKDTISPIDDVESHEEEIYEDPEFEATFARLMMEFCHSGREIQKEILKQLCAESERIEYISSDLIENLENSPFIPHLCQFILDDQSLEDSNLAQIMTLIRHMTVLSTPISMLFLQNGIGEWIRRKLYSQDERKTLALKIVEVWSGDSDTCRRWLCFHHFVEDISLWIWNSPEDAKTQKAITILMNLCACEDVLSSKAILLKTSQRLMSQGQFTPSARILLCLGEGVREFYPEFVNRSIFQAVLDIVMRNSKSDCLPLFLKFLFVRANYSQELEVMVACGVVRAVGGLVSEDPMICKWVCFVWSVVIEKSSAGLEQFFEAGYLDISRHFLFEREHAVASAALLVFSSIFSVRRDAGFVYETGTIEILERCIELLPSVSAYFQEPILSVILGIVTDEEKSGMCVVTDIVRSFADQIEQAVPEENEKCTCLWRAITGKFSIG